MLVDRYGRPVDRLRISITQRCNLRCFYCHKEGIRETGGSELSPEELSKIVEVAASLDIRKVKLTGGEPLVREDIVEVVSLLSQHNLQDLGVTTNGILLPQLASPLAEAGLMRVNVNLPSLSPDVYRRITGVDRLHDVLSGINAARDAGLTPIKLNYVVLKGLNDGEFHSMLDYARRVDAILQIIELEPTGSGRSVYGDYHVDLKPYEEWLLQHASKTLTRKFHFRKQYLVDGVWVELVKPIHNPLFCLHCTRLRLTSSGKLKTCLMSNKPEIDLKPLLDKPEWRELLREAFLKAVSLRKPFYQ